MTKEPATKGTAISALEAERNEQQVLAEGALHGERRAAVARLVMVGMFAIVANIDSDDRADLDQMLVGTGYTLWAILIILVLRRAKGGVPKYARRRPLFVTAVDFAFVTTMGLLDSYRGDPFEPGQLVVASTIVMSFSVARYGLFHIVYSTSLGVVGYLVSAWYGGALASSTTPFVIGGYVVFGFMLAVTNRALHGMFAGLRQRDNLTRFLPRQVAERVMRAGPMALAPVEREVTVMFTDIRGFTSMSEGKEPREILMMLDDYFGRMSQVVKGHDGVVGKFLGDGMLAFWGVPDAVDDHAVRAVRCARDMRRAVLELNHHRERTGDPPIRIGIGIHTGPVAAGMLGGALQAEYTVIGDAVNVASRIEQLTKEHSVDVLVSETTWAQLSGPRGQRIASAEIRGRKEPVVLYTIDTSAGTVEVSPVANTDGTY